MAGKTGTAQVRAYSAEEHLHGVTKDSALDWKLRDHGLFIAFAPVAQPKYACACIVEHGAVGHPQVLLARAILYSVAGGHFHPWALAQLSKFLVGLLVMVVAATIDVRVWMGLAYPAYA